VKNIPIEWFNDKNVLVFTDINWDIFYKDFFEKDNTIEWFFIFLNKRKQYSINKKISKTMIK